MTVAVTPNGYADAVTDEKFVMPEEREMTLAQFLDIMEQPESDKGVFYVQKQNSNLTDEFHSVIADVDTEIVWGSEAFGNLLEINFIMLYFSLFVTPISYTSNLQQMPLKTSGKKN